MPRHSAHRGTSKKEYVGNKTEKLMIPRTLLKAGSDTSRITLTLHVIAGLITVQNTWRTTYYVVTALVGFCFIFIFFTMPATSFRRNTTHRSPRVLTGTRHDADAAQLAEKEAVSQVESAYPPLRKTSGKKSYKETFRIWNVTYVDEGLLKIFIRAWRVFLLPTVLWSTVVAELAVGFLIAVTTKFASAFQRAYG